MDQKDQIILPPVWGILPDFWVSHKIESYNFQNLLAFGFPETSQNLISFRQLLFSLFQFIEKIPKPQKSAKIALNWGQDDLMIWAKVKKLSEFKPHLINETYLRAMDYCGFRLGRPTSTKAWTSNKRNRRIVNNKYPRFLQGADARERKHFRNPLLKQGPR